MSTYDHVSKDTHTQSSQRIHKLFCRRYRPSKEPRGTNMPLEIRNNGKGSFVLVSAIIANQVLTYSSLNPPYASDTLSLAHLCPLLTTACMVITYSRVWINRVRLPILLVVS